MERPVTHTPGPWEVQRLEGDTVQLITTVAAVSAEQPNSVRYIAGVHSPEDAELIAAAPEMLEMLRRLEYVAMDFGHVMRCSSCKFDEDSGHRDNCKLAALLKRIDERRGSDPMIE